MPHCAALIFCALSTLLLTGCSELETKKPDNYYSANQPPAIRELRWSNGARPRTLDPALAVAPPETDIVRAMFEGLTELDPRTLEALPAAASSWRSNSDATEWTFDLRPDARWSNGSPLTAEDFVRSWKRAASISTSASNTGLFENIAGFSKLKNGGQPAGDDTAILDLSSSRSFYIDNTSEGNTTEHERSADEFGVAAEGEKQLKIKLIEADRDFPKLVAHTVFRPTFENNSKDTFIEEISNGAFRLGAKDESEIQLLRSDAYWNNDSVELDSVKFIASQNAEQALEAYREGRVDIITNAELSPLALKILSGYDDFRRTPYAALNFYEINVRKPPFDDIRVREALAISIERERIITADLDGVGEPALSLSPFAARTEKKITEDKAKARDLLERAGFPGGEGFPTIELVINRNDMQQRIARSIAKMWQDELNIRTEFIIKESAEMENVRRNNEFDLIRRGVVFRTASEKTNLDAVYSRQEPEAKEPETVKKEELLERSEGFERPLEDQILLGDEEGLMEFEKLLTEADSLLQFQIISIYFPESFALVKPYVSGFYLNSLDAHLLSNVRIDGDWTESLSK